MRNSISKSIVAGGAGDVDGRNLGVRAIGWRWLSPGLFRPAFRPGFVGFHRSFGARGRTPGNRDLDVANPVFQAVIGPFVVAFIVVGASRLGRLADRVEGPGR